MFGDKVLVLDFGGTQAQSVARKIRGERVYCEVLPYSASPEAVAERGAKGLLLAGGAEVDGEAPRPDPGIFRLGLPVLALGYGARLLAKELGGNSRGVLAEGRTAEISFAPCALFEGLSKSDRFLERVDALELPGDFETLAESQEGLAVASGSGDRRMYLAQFYPESNDPDGLRMLSNFAVGICGCGADWSMERFVERSLADMKARLGGKRALVALSGGVDSSVCAALAHRAMRDALTCLYVNTGLMRKGETELVTRVFRDQLGMELRTVDASRRFLALLQGVTDPGEKRRLVVAEMLKVFAEEAAKLGEFDCLVQGTIYPDVLNEYFRSGSYGMSRGASLAEELRFAQVEEPLRVLFKDEVRQVGELLEVPRELISRQPFPGPGLAVRCIGEVTEEKLQILREADAIFRGEIADAGLDKRIWQYFAVLTDVRSMGLRDGGRCYEHTVALRAVSSQDAVSASAVRLPYDLLERVVQRITTEVKGVNRVVYDVTGKPTAMIEWE